MHAKWCWLGFIHIDIVSIDLCISISIEGVGGDFSKTKKKQKKENLAIERISRRALGAGWVGEKDTLAT